MTAPSTRNLREVITAIGVTQRELRYQVDRLTSGLAQGSTPAETDHLADLARRYAEADDTLSKLWGYHTGRLERADAAAREGHLPTPPGDPRAHVGGGE